MDRILRAVNSRTLLLLALGGMTLACEGAQGEKGSSGAAGAACVIKDNGDGTKTITCGTTEVKVSDGKTGTDAKDCTAKDNGDGTKTITCPDGTAVTVQNGSNGSAGSSGSNGSNGTNGKDGNSCTVKENGDGTKTVACTDGTNIVIKDGATGVQGEQGVAGPQGATGTTGEQGPQGATGTTGDTGAAGKDGTSCTVKDNGNGSKTITCSDGTSVTIKDGSTGPTGPVGPTGGAGGGIGVTSFHGLDYLKTSGEYLAGAKTDAKMTITAATADDAGKLVVKFKVADAVGKPVPNVAAVSANIAKLVGPDATAGESFTKWVNYIYRIETVSGSAAAKDPWPAKDGDIAIQAYREASGSSTTTGLLTNNNDGSYTYEFVTNLAKATVDGKTGSALVGYDRKLTHRVSVMIGGHSGATADAVFDFVPDTSITTLPATRNIVQTSACQACHGTQFKGHGGDRLTVENCVTCHNPSSFDAQSKQSLDAKVMIHKIHAGGNLASIAGPDGQFWNDTATAADETKDNGLLANVYAIWGYGNAKTSWYKAGFPAELPNCTKCHNGSGQNVDAWKTPSRAACGSCHDNVDFTTGVNHKGGAQATDSKCTICHDEGGYGMGVVEAHNWTAKDPRLTPEFNVELSISAPKSGKSYYEAGDAPLVTVILKDAKTGTAIDHTTMIEGAAEGCWTGTAPTTLPPATCQTRNGKFGDSAFFVHGPRAFRSPALTMAARAKILSTTLGPWDLSADAAPSLTVTFDGGQSLVTYDATGGDKLVAGSATVAIGATAYVSKSAVTATELATAFNANAAFKARGIAYIDEATGKFAVRSRNLGKVFSVQFAASALNTTVFGGNVIAAGTNSSTASNALAKRTAVGAIDDPKVVRAAGKITYQLDAVDDLPAGTYTVSVELGDRYRVDGDNFVTPSVAFLNFTVKQATEELPVARNCQTCHQNADGDGLIVDPSRHNKHLRDLALDQCGSCHDYQPQNPKDLSNTPFNQGWQGAHPISRRVHAIHNGAAMNFPLQTVWYSNGDPEAGRNWDITLPVDVRNCQMCHTDKTTSGTWATKPGRLACWGCHDSTPAQAHFAAQTYDPTPLDPFSGDESESCATCHN